MIKNKFTYITVFLILLLPSCSLTTLNLKKNTWAARTYHHTTSRFNAYFNGNEAFEEGVEKISKSNKDDYTRVLRVFEDKDHETYSAANADMDYAIEKANKIIQLHSIKLKPEYNSAKMKDPKYREWRNQEEFNPMVDDAYMLLGKARFYKGEFMEAVGVFNYVTLKYASKEVWYLANLWIARAYIEMGWLYEAENMLNLVNDDNFPFEYEDLYFTVNADLHIKRGEYKDAAPLLKSALETKITRAEKQRYRYILAQIYQEQGEYDLAYEMYRKVVRSIPEYEMEFNAIICMTEVMADNDNPKAIRKLERMLKDPKNLEYKGEIYYALGNINMASGNKDEAIENYRLSIAFSQGVQNGVTSHTIADLYWEDQEYRKAAPYYAMATTNLPEDYPKSYEVNFRSEKLAELESYYSVMGEQDREYLLSQMSDSERKEALKKEEEEAKREEKILKLIAEAQGDAEKETALQEERNVEIGDWYFYNANLVNKGKDDFRERWGDRELKDNWRRSMAVDFGDADDDYEDDSYDDESDEVYAENDTIPNEQTDEQIAKKQVSEQKQKALNDKAIVDSYFNLATLYQFDIKDNPKTIETFQSLEAQYPNSPYSPDSYYSIYTTAQENGMTTLAADAKSTILSKYPESKYALILTDPNAKNILLKDKKDYNELYEQTFALFQEGKNYDVLDNIDKLKTEFRDSSLQAKVLLMEALATAKTDYNADVKAMLTKIKEGYPKDEEVQMQVGIIMAQLSDGKKVQLGGSAANNLSIQREKQAEIQREKLLQEQQFRHEPDARHYMVMLMADSSNVNQNHLLYDVSRFNFNKFMTMDFDLSFSSLNEEVSILVVNGFSNEEESKWYQSEIMMTNIPNKYPDIIKWYVISEENFRLFMMLKSYKEYDEFVR